MPDSTKEQSRRYLGIEIGDRDPSNDETQSREQLQFERLTEKANKVFRRINPQYAPMTTPFPIAWLIYQQEQLGAYINRAAKLASDFMNEKQNLIASVLIPTIYRSETTYPGRTVFWCAQPTCHTWAHEPSDIAAHEQARHPTLTRGPTDLPNPGLTSAMTAVVGFLRGVVVDKGEDDVLSDALYRPSHAAAVRLLNALKIKRNEPQAVQDLRANPMLVPRNRGAVPPDR
jgi:hypothetical protein